MAEAATKQAEVLVTRPKHSIIQNIGALGVAMLIDFADAVPSELLFALGLVPIPVGYEAGVGLVEAAFLNHLGVPIVKVLTLTGADLHPAGGRDTLVHTGGAGHAVRAEDSAGDQNVQLLIDARLSVARATAAQAARISRPGRFIH